MSKLSIAEIQEKINDIESSYYKGNRQSEEWWRITGDVDQKDRKLWTYYNNLKIKKGENK
tara:strand:- start:2624 stop:2803 length:180 start_codon:yes stop_codon:yes gene_type:complete